MVEQNQKVPFTRENVAKCLCAQCPVQTGSACVKAQLAKAAARGSGVMPEPEDVPGLYCATGTAACKDLNTRQMCICGDCPLWKEYALVSGKPLGYFCRDGKAH
ncbi:MAG TPA: DUF2769 domain-containing protein [Methanomicrobia archaeon]|nr:DUF2769 domain-containing protein [Methanomicrobia archaeon]